MASKKDSQRVLSGRMALLPPGDKISDSDAIVLDNWRVDQQGQLKTRKGSVLTCTVGGSGTFHTLRKIGVYRLAGVGTDLYGGAVPTGLLASGFDGQHLGMAFYLSVPIVPYMGQQSQGIAWIMNAARQVRLEQTEAMKWGVDAPVTAPTAQSQGPGQVSIEEFTGGSGVNNVSDTVDGVTFLQDMLADIPQANGGNCTASFDTELAGSGNALELLMAGAGTVSDMLTFPVPIDTTIAGQINDNDQFTLQVYLSDPTKLTSMTIKLTDATGNTVSCPFVPGSPLAPSGIFIQSPQGWTSLSIQRNINVDSYMAQIQAATASNAVDASGNQISSDLLAQLALLLQQPYFNIQAGRDPSTIGITTPIRPGTAFDWTKIATAQVSFVCSGPVQIELSAFECTGGAYVSLTGSVQYYVSFFNEVLQDGNPSPASDPITVNGEIVQLKDIPIWTPSGSNPSTYEGNPSAQVRGRYIYRVGAGLSQPLQVGIIWDNSTTEWTDPTGNFDAQDEGIVLPIDHDLPPPAHGCVGPAFGKIIAFNTDAHPARYWWTKSGQPWYFPGALDDNTGNWEDAGNDDDHIVNATVHRGVIVLYKQRSVWRVPGDPVSADAEPTSAHIGLCGPNALVNAGDIDYFGSYEGVYLFDMDAEHKISEDIDPIFHGDYVQLSNGEFIPPIEPTAIGTCAMSLVSDRLRYSYPEKGQSTPNVTLVYHISSQRWVREKYNNLASPGFTAMNWDGPGNLMAGVGSALYALEQDGVPTDNGASMHVLWQSRFFDMGLPDFYKHLSDLEVEYQTAGYLQAASTLSVYIVYNNGVKVSLGTISSATRTKNMFSLKSILASYQQANDEGLLAFNAAVRLEGDVTSECTIFGTFLHWYPEERRAVTFDSGFTNFGIPDRVKQVDYLEYYETATGSTQARNFYSDLPGRQLALRLSDNVAGPTGRGTIRQRLSAIVEGRNFRLALADANPFQMHLLRARMRPIGDYIDGTNGEFYESPEFSIAPGRVGEVKDFLLDYDVSGPGGLLELYTDLPGAALTIRRSMQIPYQASGRNIYVFPFEAEGDSISDFLPNGQLFKVRLYPPPGGILRLHGRATFRARVIGVYFNGANGEVFQTQPIDLCNGMGLFRELQMIVGSPGTINITVETQLPGAYDMTTAAQLVSPPTRTPAFFRLPGNTKGILQRVTLASTDVCRAWEIKLLCRSLQLPGGPWEWKAIPMPPTPDAFDEINMPVARTPEEFTWVDVPVDEIN